MQSETHASSPLVVSIGCPSASEVGDLHAPVNRAIGMFLVGQFRKALALYLQAAGLNMVFPTR
jgi:hypothetical protein